MDSHRLNLVVVENQIQHAPANQNRFSPTPVTRLLSLRSPGNCLGPAGSGLGHHRTRLSGFLNFLAIISIGTQRLWMCSWFDHAYSRFAAGRAVVFKK